MSASRTEQNLLAHIYEETRRLQCAMDEVLHSPPSSAERGAFIKRACQQLWRDTVMPIMVTAARARSLARALRNPGGLSLQQQREHVEAWRGRLLAVVAEVIALRGRAAFDGALATTDAIIAECHDKGLPLPPPRP